MFEIFALIALVGGVYWFYMRPKLGAASGLPAADPQLDAKFEAALKAVVSDPVTLALTPKGDATLITEMARELRTTWTDKEPQELAQAAGEIRGAGAAAIAKKIAGAEAYAVKTRALSEILRTKINELTGQGKNLDKAFKEIDEGKMPLSDAAMTDGAMIDKAALSPVLFVKTSEGLSKEGATNMFGNFVLPGGTIVGTGNVEEIRMVGAKDGQMIGVGRIVSFKVDPPPPAGTYFGVGTNIYTATATS